jgi:hypothetical protein
VIAGSNITAGLDNDPDGEADLDLYDFALVVEFKSADDMREAIRSGKVEFTVDSPPVN